MHTKDASCELNELCIVANFVETFQRAEKGKNTLEVPLQCVDGDDWTSTNTERVLLLWVAVRLAA
jgi:hypothetical protein